MRPVNVASDDTMTPSCLPPATVFHIPYTKDFRRICPNHSAMFMYANGSEQTLNADFGAMQGQRLTVKLAQKDATIYFTNAHIADLRAITEADAGK